MDLFSEYPAVFIENKYTFSIYFPDLPGAFFITNKGDENKIEERLVIWLSNTHEAKLPRYISSIDELQDKFPYSKVKMISVNMELVNHLKEIIHV